MHLGLSKKSSLRINVVHSRGCVVNLVVEYGRHSEFYVWNTYRCIRSTLVWEDFLYSIKKKKMTGQFFFLHLNASLSIILRHSFHITRTRIVWGRPQTTIDKIKIEGKVNQERKATRSSAQWSVMHNSPDYQYDKVKINWNLSFSLAVYVMYVCGGDFISISVKYLLVQYTYYLLLSVKYTNCLYKLDCPIEKCTKIHWFRASWCFITLTLPNNQIGNRILAISWIFFYSHV